MANPTRPRRGATRSRQLRRNNCIPAVHTRDKDIGSTIVGHRRSVCTIGCQEGRGPQEYQPSNLRARAPGHADRRRPGRERRPAATIGPSAANKHSELVGEDPVESGDLRRRSGHRSRRNTQSWQESAGNLNSCDANHRAEP